MVSHNQNLGRGRFPAFTSLALAAALVAGLSACSPDDGDDGAPGDPGPSPEIEIGAYEALPGVNVAITAVSGGSGAGGNVRVGDILTVQFSAEDDAGDPLDLSNFTRGSIYVSGPTFNYQRVIASQSDVLTRATEVSDGVYSYRFAVPVPSTFLAPLNDTASLTDGELTGQALLNGTYTVGLELRKDFTVEGEVFRDVGNATSDFLFGTATTLETREVVLREACNACHTNLQAHGGNRTDITNCLLCHTAGAEDRNTANVAGGTPGVGIEFSVMIHKIHTGTYLPSVLGIATNPDGSRKYDATPKPYQMIGFGDSLIDFSHVVFPAYPSFASPMPRDFGYTPLNSTQKSLEDRQRRGPVECAKCHGDPDGVGPLTAPSQGDRFKTHPTTRACGSCHDDWDPAKPYTANQQTMPANLTDADCTLCHDASGTPLAIENAHMHPLSNPALATGVHFVFDQVTDAGGDNDGNFDAGETVRITFRVENDNGDPVAASSLSRIEAVLSGPTMNPQVMDYQRIPPAYFTGNGPYTIDLPDLAFYEPAGTSNNTLQVFTTLQAPHWNVTGGATTLLLRTGTGNSSTLVEAARPTQNYIDVVAGQGSLFTNGAYIVIDDLNGAREYMRVVWVNGDRLWFNSKFRQTNKANLLNAHNVGATVQVVTTTAIPTGSYTLNATTGEITETVEFGNGEVLASYMTSFKVPTVFPGSLVDGPEKGEDWGDWTGLPVLDGTYILDFHGARSFSTSPAGEATSYTEGALSTRELLLFGNATVTETFERVVGASACNKCHEDLAFHGGSRRGFDTCISCHGTAGAELTQGYETLSVPTGPIASVEFRNFLHSAHEEVFTSMPAGVKNCAVCHGDSNEVWKAPIERVHPAATTQTRAWYVACSSCHASNAQVAHMDVNTAPNGAESCAVCHGEGAEYEVTKGHFFR
jgi:hypothetical protein